MPGETRTALRLPVRWRQTIPLVKGVDRAGHAVFGLDLPAKGCSLCPHGLIPGRKGQGISQTVHGEFTAWDGVGRDAQLEQTASPERLVAHERDDDGWDAGAES